MTDRPTGPATLESFREVVWKEVDGRQWTTGVREGAALAIEAETKARILAALPEALAQAMYGKPGMGATLDSCRREAAALAAAIEAQLSREPGERP